MSDILKVTDPRSHITSIETAAKIIHEGCQRITNVQIPAQGGGLNSANTQFTFTVPQDHLLERVIMLQCQVTFTTGNNAIPFSLGDVDGLRQFPLNSCIQTLQVKLNNLNITDTVADRVHMLMAFGNRSEDRDKYWTLTPCMPDQFSSYDSPVDYQNRNPLAPYCDNTNEQPRGAFRPISGVLTSGQPANIYETQLGKTQAIRSLTFLLTEPLILSPLSPGLFDDEVALAHINKIDISINWYPLTRAWCQSTAQSAAMSMTAAFTASPQLLLNYLTPDNVHAIPPTQMLPWNIYVDYPRTDLTINAGQSIQFVSDTIQTSRIPQRLFIWAPRSRSSFTQSTPDSFAVISNLQVTFENDNTLFASCTQQELYRISCRNGLNMTYGQWAFYRGGPMCLEFGVDLGLAPGKAPGVEGNYNLRVQCTFTNTDSQSHTFDCYMTTENNGVVILSKNNGVAYDGLFTKDEVLMAKESQMQVYDQAGTSEVGAGLYRARGGSWFSDKLKGFVNKFAKVAKVVLPTLAPQYAGIGNPLADLAIKYTGGKLKKSGHIKRSQLLLQ